MATDSSKRNRKLKRHASHSLVEIGQSINRIFESELDWTDDYEFLSPNAIFTHSLGLVYHLTSRNLIHCSFIKLYQNSLKLTWMNILMRERQHLKSNINSVEKCFMLNRLITECKQRPLEFAQQTGELYEEIKRCISTEVVYLWTVENFYHQVEFRQNLQSQRRLFYLSHMEVNQSYGLLALQQIATQLYSEFLNLCQTNWSQENHNHLKKILQNCFIIMNQPSVPECVAAAKYEKNGNTYTAKLNSRVLCLLNPTVIEQSLIKSNIGITLLPCDPNVDFKGEEQESLSWQKRHIIDPEHRIQSFLFAELQSIELKKMGQSNLRPLYSSKLCKINFEIEIKITSLNRDEKVLLTTDPFGICSHTQYYSEYVAELILYEVAKITKSERYLIQPHILADFVNRYYIRITNVEPKIYTKQYISDILRTTYEERSINTNVTSVDVYKDILSKLLSQMDIFIDYPFLSMMYDDGLFLGICDHKLDQQLYGTRQEPHILLRINSLAEHQSTQRASIRFIVHNGTLTKATFHPKAFIDEMCQMICKANVCLSTNRNYHLAITNRKFHDFNLYFDKDLFRLDAIASQVNDAYQPIIPVLWDIMRISNTEQSGPNEEAIDFLNPSSFNTASNSVVLPQSVNLPINNNPSKSNHLQNNSSDDNITSLLASVQNFLTGLTDGNIQQQKQILSHLSNSFLRSKTYAEVSTQTSNVAVNNSPYNFFDDEF